MPLSPHSCVLEELISPMRINNGIIIKLKLSHFGRRFSELIFIPIVSFAKETDLVTCLVTAAATGTSSFGASSTEAPSSTTSSTTSSFGASSTGASSFGADAATLSPPAQEFRTLSTETPDAAALASAERCTKSTGAFNISATLLTKSLIYFTTAFIVTYC